MKKVTRLWIIALLTLIYIISPVDFLPGIPIDDIIAAFVGIVAFILQK
jgi:hypothetical protein